MIYSWYNYLNKNSKYRYDSDKKREKDMNKEQLHNFIKDKQPNICQISCYKNGKEVYSDQWNNYKASDTCHIMSATKSIVALLIGIAIDKGLIKDINQKVLDFFPNYRIKRGEKTIQNVTIKHLLTMTAPYKCKGDPWSKVCSSNNWTYTSLDILGGRKGITNEFNYQTVCLHILSGILYKVSKMKTIDFANKYLFEPLGIKKHINYYAETAEEHKHFTMDKLPKGDIWFCDPDGLGTPGYGLCLSANDMAKIGLLCLNNGIWNNETIVSSDWIKLITTPTYKCGENYGNMFYGYLWWIIDEKQHVYAAIGNSGNVIYVNKIKNIVVAITSYFKPTIFDRIDFIEEYIVPFILC